MDILIDNQIINIDENKLNETQYKIMKLANQRSICEIFIKEINKKIIELDKEKNEKIIQE